jgi:hypothetical protein
MFGALGWELGDEAEPAPHLLLRPATHYPRLERLVP